MMELFDEVYSCYYQVVAKILYESADSGISRKDMEELSMRYGFEESALTIVPKLIGGQWKLIKESDGGLYFPTVNVREGGASQNDCKRGASESERIPLTGLQKSYMKALFSDPKIELFFDDNELTVIKDCLKSVKPLFSEDDFYYFDRFADGDDFEDEKYREIFATVLKALKKKKRIRVKYQTKRNEQKMYDIVPCSLQYSSKNDKFRLCGFEMRLADEPYVIIINLGRIVSCEISDELVPEGLGRFEDKRRMGEVMIRISNERNALERCMLSFANYEKHTEYDAETGIYNCTIRYEKSDETELLIQILSFGPTIRVIGPQDFLRQIKQRVLKQHRLFTGYLR